MIRELPDAGEAPIGDVLAGQLRLEAVVDRVARRWEDDLAPAIERVWKDCIAGVKIDLREGLRRVSEGPGGAPGGFELSFGLPERSQRDPHSKREAVLLGQGIRLSGSSG